MLSQAQVILSCKDSKFLIGTLILQFMFLLKCNFADSFEMTVLYKKNQFEVANLRLLYESQNFERYKLCLKNFFIIFTALN